MIVRRVGVLSAAKLAGVIYATFGLIGGAFFALIALGTSALQTAATDDGLPAAFGALFGVGAIVFFPILYGVLGFIAGALGAAIYNIAAGLIGGLELETDPR